MTLLQASQLPQDLAERYVALWNERDTAARQAQIRAFWAPNGLHFVRTLEVRGYEQLDSRVQSSHEKNVRDGGYVFRAVQNAQILQNVLMFNWEMVPATGGDVAAVGLEFVTLDDQGRATCDYQFIVA